MENVSETNSLTESKKMWLSNLIAEKMKKNPHFSLRAFARRVEISPTVLSRILSGKRNLTFNLAVRIADALLFTPEEREELFSYFTKKNEKDANAQEDKNERQITLECFNAMKDWYHYGITQLLQVKGFVEDYQWIASMLSISSLEAKLAVDRLLRLEILERDENGKLHRTATHFTTTSEVASSGLRHFQKQILEKSIISLEEDSLDERDITSITVAINEDKIKEAKLEIKKFRMRMSEFMSEGEKTRVYNLGIHLIPLSKSTKKLRGETRNEINH